MKSLSEIIDFIQANPQYNIEAAQAAGISPEELNVTTYALASKLANFIRGGISAEKNVTVTDVDSGELAAGTSHELRHTPDESIAKKIALDNLAETPDYYTRITKMMKQSIAAAYPVKQHTTVNDPEWSYKQPESSGAKDSIPWNTPTIDY